MILLVAVTFVLAAVLYVLLTSVTGAANSAPPLSTVLAFGRASSTAGAGHHWYNFTIASAREGLELRNLEFGLQNANHSVLSPPAGSNVTVRGVSGTIAATYSLVTGAWGAGATSLILSSDTFSLDTGATAVGGGTLSVYGTLGYTGFVTVSLPPP